MDQIGGIEIFWLWLILAGLLAIGEIAIAPGIYLIFIAGAAALMGVLTSLIGLSMPTQLILFGILSVVCVYLGRGWYRQADVRNQDPLLNDRSARLVGQTVTVTIDVSDSSGRARVGDSEWPARGEHIPAGAKARISHVDNGVLILTQLD